MTLGEADCLRKGPWTVEEDIRLMSYISIHGDGRWNSLAKSSGLKRSGKSCRLRWVNYLRPDLKRGNITADEERLIIDLQRRWGNRWSRIARHLPGRTDNEIKNYWRTRIRSKFLRIRSAAAVAKSKEEVITSSSNRANLHRNEVEYNQTTSSSTTWNPIARLQTQEQEQISHASRATMNTTINNSISSSSMMNVAPLCNYSSEEKLEEGGGLIACSDKELFGSMMLAEEFLCNDGDIDIDMDGIIIGGNMRACSWSHNTYVNCGGANVVNNDTNMNMINTDSFDFP